MVGHCWLKRNMYQPNSTAKASTKFQFSMIEISSKEIENHTNVKNLLISMIFQNFPWKLYDFPTFAFLNIFIKRISLIDIFNDVNFAFALKFR